MEEMIIGRKSVRIRGKRGDWIGIDQEGLALELPGKKGFEPIAPVSWMEEVMKGIESDKVRVVIVNKEVTREVWEDETIHFLIGRGKGFVSIHGPGKWMRHEKGPWFGRRVYEPWEEE